MSSRSILRSIFFTAIFLMSLNMQSPRAYALTVENVTFADSVTIGGTPVPLQLRCWNPADGVAGLLLGKKRLTP